MPKIELSTQYGLKAITINLPKGKHICVQNANRCIPGWVDFYENPKKPYAKWHKSWLFNNRSGYDSVLGRYRVWFCLLGFVVTA